MSLTRQILNTSFRKILLNSRKLHWSSMKQITESSLKGTSQGVSNFNSKDENFDILTEEMKTAVSSVQILDIVSAYLPQFKSNQILKTLKILFNLQKQGSNQNIIEDQNFALLCKKLRKECRSMNINETIEAIKILTYMGVPNNSLIIQALLQLVKNSINELSLQHVIFLDFLLRKFKEPIPIVEALLMALPLVFQLQVKHEIDHENINELVDCIQYASKLSLPTNCMQCIISALTLHGEDLPVFAAKSVLWSLCDLKNFEITYERLLMNVLNIIKKNIHLLSIEDMDKTLSKIAVQFKENNYIFYDEEFLDRIVEYLIENKCSFMEIIWILKKMTRMSYVNISILDYLGELIAQDTQILSKGRPAAFFTIIGALSLADYKTKNWNAVKKAITESDILINGKDELPWSKCAVELASLNIFCDDLLKRIFSPAFLNKFLSREFNVLDHFQLLHVHQAVKTMHKSYDGPFLSADIVNQAINFHRPLSEQPSLKSALINALGHDKNIAHGVSSKLGHFIDYVIVLKNGQPIPVVSAVDQDILFIENIMVPQDSIIICILILPNGCYSINNNRMKGVVRLKIQTLEALHYKVLSISNNTWKNLDDREKIPFLLREIKLCTN